MNPNNRTTTLGGTESLCVYDGATGAVLFSWDALKMGANWAKDPALSPDGRTVAIACGEPTLEGLALVDLQDLVAGRPNPRLLVKGERLFPSAATAFKAFNVSVGGPAWSPDGRLIAFNRAALGEIVAGDLWVVNADGSGLRQLTNLGPQKLAVQPCFSPDGRSLAFTLISGKTGFIPPEQLLTLNVNMNVAVVDLAGGGVKQLTTDNMSGGPAWGP
jgi:Tol biopolymer transport system component